MKRVRRFVASVEYKDAEGQTREETFPVIVEDYSGGGVSSAAVAAAHRGFAESDFRGRGGEGMPRP